MHWRHCALLFSLLLAGANGRPSYRPSAASSQTFFLGDQGESCYQVCLAEKMNCNGGIRTNNSDAAFAQLGVACPANESASQTHWWAEDQPSYVSDPSDGNYGLCLGYVDVPQNVQCGGNYPTTRRLCVCDDVVDSPAAFGTGISGGVIPAREFDVFAWTLAPGAWGVMTNFWITNGNQAVWENVTVRYYVDGEPTASVAFNPGLATGVGFGDSQPQWGTKWVGKPGVEGSYYVNIRVPFWRSVRVTWQHDSGDAWGSYIVVRGAPNLPISFQGASLPMVPSLRLRLVAQQRTLAPLDYFDVVNVPAGTSGMYFYTVLAVRSGNLNFLEGCYRFHSPPDQPYPGTLLSTGTEDYYLSSFYFDGGEYHLPVSGFTHIDQPANASLTWSAYRFHEMDPLFFNDGFRLVWRNGDAIDPRTGLKCFIERGGLTVGSPTQSDIQSYAWLYTW